MPELLAAIRPDDQSFALLLHLVGATVVFGALLASATSLALARGETRLLRLGYFSLLLVGLPGLILMRLAGEWLYRLQNWDELPDQIDEPAWLKIGFIVADWGGLLFLAGARARRGRRLPVAPRQGRHRSAQGDDGHLARPHRRLRRRGVGDDRQAELAPRTSRAIPRSAGGGRALAAAFRTQHRRLLKSGAQVAHGLELSHMQGFFRYQPLR